PAGGGVAGAPGLHRADAADRRFQRHLDHPALPGPDPAAVGLPAVPRPAAVGEDLPVELPGHPDRPLLHQSGSGGDRGFGPLLSPRPHGLGPPAAGGGFRDQDLSRGGRARWDRLRRFHGRKASAGEVGSPSWNSAMNCSSPDGGLAPRAFIRPVSNRWMASPTEPTTASAAANSSALTPIQ